MFELNIDGLVEKLLPEAVDKTIIEGGHYLLEERGDGKVEHLINPESTLTFEAAVRLYKKAKDGEREVALSFLVGDLAVAPERRREHNQNFQLDTDYVEILRRYGVGQDEVIFFYESRLRNRGDNKIKRGIKKGKVIEWLGSYRLNPDVFGIADQISNSPFMKRPVPNCRMLLAQELQDKEMMGFEKAINICNSDVYNCRGKYSRVYHTLLEGKMEVINVYFIRVLREMKIEIKKYKGKFLPEHITVLD